MLSVILGGGTLALCLMLLALHLIARSITGPLVSLAKAVSSSPAGIAPTVPVMDRKDEIGNLTKVIHTMSNQVRAHLAMRPKIGGGVAQREPRSFRLRGQISQYRRSCALRNFFHCGIDRHVQQPVQPRPGRPGSRRMTSEPDAFRAMDPSGGPRPGAARNTRKPSQDRAL